MIFIIKRKAIYLLSIVTAVIAFAGAKLYLNSRSAVEAIADTPKGYIAIVIDDFGYNGEGTEDMLNLDIPLTAAVMPFSSNSSENAKLAIEKDKEVIIHMPMESLTGKRSWVGDKAVFCSMTDEEIKSTVEEAFNIVEGATGMNNHMGSGVMEDERALTAVLEVVSEKGLYFVDSKTSQKSKADEICERLSVPILDRDVFLDSTTDVNFVKKRLLKAGEVALETGFCVAIGA